MSVVDELSKLGKLKQDGLLTEAEFLEAKRKVLKESESNQTASHSTASAKPSTPNVIKSYHRPNHHSESLRSFTENDSSIGNAANRYVTFQIIMGVLGFILFLVFASKMFPSSSSRNSGFGQPSIESLLRNK